jgi:hypothetical protein
MNHVEEVEDTGLLAPVPAIVVADTGLLAPVPAPRRHWDAQACCMVELANGQSERATMHLGDDGFLLAEYANGDKVATEVPNLVLSTKATLVLPQKAKKTKAKAAAKTAAKPKVAARPKAKAAAKAKTAAKPKVAARPKAAAKPKAKSAVPKVANAAASKVAKAVAPKAAAPQVPNAAAPNAAAPNAVASLFCALRKTRARKPARTYLTAWCDQKRVLLVEITQSMSPNHEKLIDRIKAEVEANPRCTKQDALGLRRQFLEAEVPA